MLGAGGGVGFNLSQSSRCCCHAPPRPPPPRAHDSKGPRPRSARGARAPSTPAPPRAPRAPSPTGTCRCRRCRRRHLQPPQPRLAHPPRAPREGSTPYSDWLRAGQPSLETAEIGRHEADGQLLKPIIEEKRRGYRETQWVPRVVLLGARCWEARAWRRAKIGALEEDGHPW